MTFFAGALTAAAVAFADLAGDPGLTQMLTYAGN